MQYLQGTYTMELVFRGDLQPLIRYTNSDWAEYIFTRHLTSGYIFNKGRVLLFLRLQSANLLSYFSPLKQDTFRRHKQPKKPSS